MVFNALDRKACYTTNVLDCVVSMCIHFSKFIHYNVITSYEMRLNEINFV